MCARPTDLYDTPPGSVVIPENQVKPAFGVCEDLERGVDNKARFPHSFYP